MNWMVAAYGLLLRLYPRGFREAYAEEMQTVYADSLHEARRGGALALGAFALREVFDLPASLVREHVYAIRAGKTQLRPALQGAGGGDAHIAPPAEPARPWEVFMAALPQLLFGLVMGATPLLQLLLGVSAVTNRMANILSAVLVFFAGLVGIPLTIWKRRRDWVGSWYVMYVLLALLLASLLSADRFNLDPQQFPAAMLVLALAFGLYYAARANAVRGLLAALPFSLMVWVPYMENTPKTIIDPFLASMIYLGSWIMLALVAAVAAQSRRLGLSLALALCVMVISGFGFSYLGNYQGGMLPFSEPGPSIRVVMLYGIRTLLVAAAMLLGPQLARCLRSIGMRTGRLGSAGYRVALLGIVLLIAAFLLNIIDSMFRAEWNFQFMLQPPLDMLFFAGVLVYHVGYALLVAGVWRARENRFWLELALLYGLIPAVPAILFLGWPTRIHGPSLTVWQIAPPALLWMVASTWLVARFGRRGSALLA